MRSRYAAYVTGNTEYLLATWHPRMRPESLTHEPGVKWLGLEVRRHQRTGPETAEVEFVARSRHAGRGHRLHEHSRFVREDGQWLYVDGDIL
jgi:SEC-C motif-containing protein